MSTTSEKQTFTPFFAKINVPLLNVRIGAGTDNAVKSTLKEGDIYEIVETAEGQGSKAGWGRLKFGGWIALDYCVKVNKGYMR